MIYVERVLVIGVDSEIYNLGSNLPCQETNDTTVIHVLNSPDNIVEPNVLNSLEVTVLQTVNLVGRYANLEDFDNFTLFIFLDTRLILNRIDDNNEENTTDNKIVKMYTKFFTHKILLMEKRITLPHKKQGFYKTFFEQ